MKNTGKALFIVVILVFTGCSGGFHNPHNAPGIDLSKELFFIMGDLAFDKNGNPMLNGKAVKEEDWERYNLRWPPKNKSGEAVLWIRTKLPEMDYPDPVLYFPAGSYLQNFDIFIGRDQLYRVGKACPSKALIHPLQPNLVPVQKDSGGKELYMRFCTNQHGRMGFVEPMYSVSERSLISRIIVDQIDRIVLGFIFIFTGFLYLLIFLKNFQHRLYSMLAFFIMSASIGLFTIFSSDIFILFFIDPDTAGFVTLFAIIFFPVGLFLFIDQTIGVGYKSIIRRSWQIFLILAAGALITIPAGIRFHIMYIALIRSVVFTISIIAALIELSRAIISGNRGARVISIGLLIFGFSFIGDFILKKTFIRYNVLHFHWGFFILMLMLGYLQYLAFEKAQKKLKVYSEELEEKSNILQDLNRTLEEKVQERTEEIRDKNEKLNFTNLILADRNKTIENEIAMARKIQQQLIPAGNPMDTITSLYKPMDQVGGDFYDYIDLGDEKLGIFISDVSGHGIPAALITSMVKTIILQAGPRREDPAELFQYINEVLYGQTGDNFVTAFYGILNFRKKTMTYCNAGHNNPYLITTEGPVQISGKKTLPIASMHNRMLKEKNRLFVNDTVSLPGGSKLLLYTDGLAEAVHCENRGEQFEQNVMQEILQRADGASSRELVNSLYSALVEHRGCEFFDDDVCLICVEC